MGFHLFSTLKIAHILCMYRSSCTVPWNLYILVRLFILYYIPPPFYYGVILWAQWKLCKTTYKFKNVTASLFHEKKMGKIVFWGNSEGKGRYFVHLLG